MNNPKENDQYKLFIDSFNYIVLSVSFVESNVVWLVCGNASYKYDRKKERLYKWCNTGYDAVDMQYGFSKLSGDDVWKERQQHSTVDYGFYGD
ncbi:MAG: hypothetical protein [Caudoviricetes sp.]|nr:MAG: hypothetical protein [Caudoviricetes sp.]